MTNPRVAARLGVRRAQLLWLLPAAYTAGWLVYVTWSQQWERVVETWRTGLTMLFGSFVGGATPLGSGSVAFPVFTKVLEFTAPVARTFALSIQAMGLVMASLTIIIARRTIDRRAIAIGSAGGMLGFALGALVLSDPSSLWWEPRIPGPYIKVGFTVVIAAMALVIHRCYAGGAAGHGVIEHWTRRSTTVLFAFAVAGGVTSALSGSGVNVYLFLFLVMIAGVHPRIGIPTSIIAMAVIAVAGLVLFGVIGGHLATALDAQGNVVRVGTTAIDPPLPGDQYDLFGIWLGASVIVVWGASLGSWAASVASERVLIGFVGLIALTEIATTIIFLEQLREDAALAMFGIVGLVAAFIGVELLARSRSWIMATPDDPER